MPQNTRHRLLLPVVALMVILLAGCQLPSARQTPNAAPAPTTPTQSSPQTTPAKDPLAFTRTDLLTGKEVNFPGDSAGRVAVLLFFSTG